MRRLSDLTSRVPATALSTIVLFSILFGTAARAQDVTGDLLSIEQKIIRAYVTRDISVLETELAEEYVHTNLIDQRETKAEEIDEFRPGGAFTLGSATIDNAVARRYGDLAILRADVHWVGATYSPAGRPAVDVSGTYSVTRVYVRRVGRWQLLSSHASRQPRQ